MNDTPGTNEGAPGGEDYRVLARKYRPQSFDALVGQEPLVRTLTNAIRQDRIAHAFILTGVRGVGKTTTARIIARALNCVGPDGTGGPTETPCGQCEHCLAIAESRHVDVLEMDAASRTGVDNIRDLLDGVRYLPVSARYKVYIIDEVHMLSTAAFNALLKTLEEPPAHVKFVFATTEIRKVPVTVLSRCQRFDLRRVDSALLVEHFKAIAQEEGASVADDALALIADAAEGSVRDGLSLLDQAIAHGGGEVGVEQVRDMLGLADRARVFDLLELVLRGDVAGALKELQEQYRLGAEPSVVLQDMLELTHWLTRLKAVPEAAERPGVSPLERDRGLSLAGTLSMSVLARTWQMLLKGLSEVRAAPAALAAAEMILVRMAYAAELPTPADVLRRLQDDAPTTGAGTGNGGGSAADAGAPTPAQPAPTPVATAPATTPAGPPPMAPGGGSAQAAQLPQSAAEPPPESMVLEAPQPDAAHADPADFAALAALCERRDVRLYHDLIENVRPVRFEPDRIEFNPLPAAASDLAQRLTQRLTEWTGRRWIVSVNSEAEGAPPLAEQRRAAREAVLRDAGAHPLVQAVLQEFPGATITDVRALGEDGEEDGQP